MPTQHKRKRKRSSMHPTYIRSDGKRKKRRKPSSSNKRVVRESTKAGGDTRAAYIDRESKKKQSQGLNAVSLLYNLFFYSITLGLLLMSLMFSFSSKANASIFGYRFYTVMSNSMAPQVNGPSGGFYAGDMVLVRGMKDNQIKSGDIVTFAVGDGGSYLTHRVVEKRNELNGESGSYLITKGDANNTNDPPIETKRVFGKVILAIPKVGAVLEFIRAEFWACVVTVISLFGFFLVIKAYLFSPD